MICKKCKHNKPLEDFYRHPKGANGRLCNCKECHKIAVKENYAKNREHYRAYERKRLHKPERIGLRKKTAKRWRETPELHARHNRMRRDWLRRKRKALKEAAAHATLKRVS